MIQPKHPRGKIIEHDSKSVAGRGNDKTVRTIQPLTADRLKFFDSDSITDRRHFSTKSEYNFNSKKSDRYSFQGGWLVD
jgi:hypothetical protein